jgi:hypothetical protein
MKSTSAIAFLLLLGMVLLAGNASGEIIRLKNGVELHGELIRFDPEEGVTVKRFDNGGVVTLRWEHIIDADVKAIKTARGYGEMEAEVILIKAQRILLITGDYVTGVPVESARSGILTLHRMGKNYEYLHNQIKDVTIVEVEAQEIYTAQELYDQKVGEALPETALDHFKLAVFCESVAFYGRALEHFKLAAELDPSFKPGAVARKVEQMELKESEAAATSHLNEIRNRLYKKKFADALKKCDSFSESFPDSRQVGELEMLRAKIIEKRRIYYQQEILSDYFSFMERVATKVATNKELSLDDALAYTRDEMGPDIRKVLASSYDMEEEEIEDLWLNRRGGRLRSANYGTGTFILGADAKELPTTEEDEGEEKKEEKAEPTTTDDLLRKRIEEIKKERSKRAKQRKSRIQIDDIGLTPEKWWKSANTNSKTQLVCAFYAEKSGDMKISRVKFRNCSACNGKGWFEYFSSGDNKDAKEPCTTCKTLAIVRIVYFK